MNTAVASAHAHNRVSVANEFGVMLIERTDKLQKMLGGSRERAERFVEVANTAVRMNPELLECSPLSLWNATSKCAAAGHIPDGKSAAFVVFRRKDGTKEAQYMPMRHGITQDILKSRKVLSIDTAIVHANDRWQYRRGDDPRIEHVPTDNPDRGPIVAAYSIARLSSGEVSREWMWLDELNKVRAVAKTQSVWNAWPEEMYRKTVLKRHAKVLPMSSEAELTIAYDDEASTMPLELERPDRPTPLAERLNRIAGGTAAANPPASDAAADQDAKHLDDLARDGESRGDEPFAVTLSRHAQNLAAAAKDGPLALSSAWAKIPADYQEQLQDTYNDLAARE